MKRNVMKTTMVVLMVYVMAFLTACSSGDIKSLPTSMAGENKAESVEIFETTDIQTETHETEYSDEMTETVEMDLATGTFETETDTTETNTDTETENESDSIEKVDDGSVAETDPDTEKQSKSSKTAESVVVEPVQDEVKPIHTHSYTGNVTAYPSCVNAGIMTYVCGCGDSYTEPIAAAGHQWTTTTETVHHPSLGHMERTERQVMKIKCRCGYVTEDDADFQAHSIAGQNAWEGDILRCPCAGSELYWTETVYEDNWVVTQEEYDEVITKIVCAICGLAQ
ncbi:MAG: hypothetical protein K2N34_10575 [Lachnospiraceae bacterium]|nr:hypothetical protein [Lachnospiraceae bacterium]